MSADLIEWNGKDIYSSTFFYRSIVIAKVLLCYNTRKTAHGIRLYFVSFPPHLISPFFFWNNRTKRLKTIYLRNISLLSLWQLFFCRIFNVFLYKYLAAQDDASKYSLIVIHFSPLSSFPSFTCILTSLLYFTLLPTLSSFNTYNGASYRRQLTVGIMTYVFFGKAPHWSTSSLVE